MRWQKRSVSQSKRMNKLKASDRRRWKCGTGKCGTANAGLENARSEKFQTLNTNKKFNIYARVTDVTVYCRSLCV